MSKGRLEAFSDGVIAILITILMLELKVPEGADLSALRAMAPTFLTYILSFVFIGIYWNNHHHMLHTVTRINGKILWANMHLLFWLSLVPFTTAWLGPNASAPVPTAVYGIVLLAAGLAYFLLQTAIIADQGEGSKLKAALGKDYKSKVSIILYASAIGLSFVDTRMADVIYVLLTAIWFIPDRRIERELNEGQR
jgi:uncharacterized membrane protein